MKVNYIEVKNDLGYTKGMKAMIASKIMKTLEKLLRYEGKVMSRISYVITKIVSEGYAPKKEENHTYYSTKLEGYTKPKTLYCLELGNTFSEITKTEFDFANWLIDSGLTTIEAIRQAEENEEKRLTAIEDEENRIAEVNKAEKEAIKDEEEKFSAWLNEETQKIVASEDDRVNTLRNLFIAEIGGFSEFHASILVLIDNMNDDRCRRALKSRLHTGNKASKKAFYHMTGIKLPATDKGTREVLSSISMDDIKSPIPYVCKPTVESCENDGKVDNELFYIKMANGDYKEVQGHRLDNKYDLEIFYHKNTVDNTYKITHIASGIAVVTNISAKKDLKKKVEEVVNQYGIDELRKMMNKAIDIHGAVPNYSTAVEEVTVAEEVVVDDAKTEPVVNDDANKLSRFMEMHDKVKLDIILKAIDRAFNKVRSYNVDVLCNSYHYMDGVLNHSFSCMIDGVVGDYKFKDIFELTLFDELKEHNLIIDDDNLCKVVYDVIYGIVNRLVTQDYFDGEYHDSVRESPGSLEPVVVVDDNIKSRVNGNSRLVKGH